MEDKIVRFVQIFSVLTGDCHDGIVLLLLLERGGGTREINAIFRKIGRGQKVLFVSAFQLPSAQSNPYAEVAYFKVAFVIPCCPKPGKKAIATILTIATVISYLHLNK